MNPSIHKPGLPPIFIIFLTIFVDMLGFGIVIPILPLYSLHFGANPTEIGFLLGSFSLMQLLFAPILGRWSDRIGRRPILVASIMGTALGFLVLGLANTLWMLFLGRIIDGVSGGNISTAQAYIADVTPPEKRSGAMGLIGAAFGLGFIFGPALGGLLGHYSMQLPFFVATGLALLNAMAIFFFLPESLTPERRQDHPAGRGYRLTTLLQAEHTALRNLLACILISTTAFSLVTAHFTLFTAHRLHWHARENGMLFAFIGVLGVLIQGGLLRRLVPRTGEKPLIILGTLILCLSMALLPLAGTVPWVILASSGLSIGNGLVTPSLTGLASKSADEQSQGVVLGISQSVASLARMLGPILGGFLLTYDLHHPHLPFGLTPFWTSAALTVLAVYLATRLPAARRDVHL